VQILLDRESFLGLETGVVIKISTKTIELNGFEKIIFAFQVWS
jgi:hypothetical protein